MEIDQTEARFETTRWTLIGAVRQGTDAERAAALGSLMERYWPAVYGYLRRSGVARGEAEEVTQDFFEDVVLSRELFGRADPSAGRLRSLVVTALANYRIDRHRRERARRDRTLIAAAAFEGEESRLGGRNGEDPGTAFDRSWAAGALSESLARCQRHFIGHGRAAHWALFESRVVRPAVAGATAPPLEAESARLGFRSAADAAAAVQTVKRRVMAVLSEVVAETVGPDEEVEDEVAALRALLG